MKKTSIGLYLFLFTLFLIFPFNKSLLSQNISGVINHYAGVLEYDFCSNSVTVDSVSSGFTVGSKVLLIQMKGAEIDTTNTISSGEVLDYLNAGNYEFAIISDIVGNEIFLRDSVIRDYDNDGFIQIVSVPEYVNATVTDTLTCKPWDGTSGGILVFDVSGTLTLNAPIDVSDKGFRGGDKFRNNMCGGGCNCIPPLYGHQYVRPNSSLSSIPKGEGIATLPSSLLGGLGTVANGGGAAGSHPYQAGHTIAFANGGAGGGNYGKGGSGGNSNQGHCSPANPSISGGVGGRGLTYSNTVNKIFLGGGGGVGHHHLNAPVGAPNFGTKGGGILIIKAHTLEGNNNDILAFAKDNPNFATNRHAASSGGGGGGTVLLDIQNYTNTVNINVKGGDGGDVQNSSNWRNGPGGGGGGGVIWLSNTTVPANINYNIDGGAGGLWYSSDGSSSLPWGATSGDSGSVITYLSLVQTSNNLFVPVAQTSTITSNSPICEGDSLHLSADYSSSLASYFWTGPNNFTSNDESFVIPNADTTHSGTYGLEIIIDGCLGPQTTLDVYIGMYPPPPTVYSDTICFGNPNPGFMSIDNNLSWYADSNLTVHLSNDTIFFPPDTTVGIHYYYVTQTDSICESDPAEFSLTILPAPPAPPVSSQTVCYGDTIHPFTISGSGIVYWYEDSTLTNVLDTGHTFMSPETSPGVYSYFVTLYDTVYNCESQPAEAVLNIIPLPYANTLSDTTICEGDTITLSVDYDTGLPTSILWSTGDTTQNINVAPLAQDTFHVVVTNICGTASDSITVFVNPRPVITLVADTTIVCSGDTVTLSATGGETYEWSHALGSAQTVVANPITTTTYTVTATNAYGCTAKEDIVITALDLPNLSVEGSTFICEGQTSTLTATGGEVYTWSTSENTASINVSPAATTTYTVTATQNGCTASQSITVEVHPGFYITIDSDFAPEHAILKGQLITFEASPDIYDYYEFYVNNDLAQSESTPIFRTAVLSHDDIVSVIAYELGCPSFPDSITVKVRSLPNAFTPFDRDGINELFAEGLELTIINKWGQELYTGTDGWNGEYKGNKVSPGTYFYIIDFNKGTPYHEIITGSITVVKRN